MRDWLAMCVMVMGCSASTNVDEPARDAAPPLAWEPSGSTAPSFRAADAAPACDGANYADWCADHNAPSRFGFEAAACTTPYRTLAGRVVYRNGLDGCVTFSQGGVACCD